MQGSRFFFFKAPLFPGKQPKQPRDPRKEGESRQISGFKGLGPEVSGLMDNNPA